MSRGWRQTASWNNEESTATEAPHSMRRQSAHVPSANVQQALWTASKRLGSCYRFLKLDLDMLAATDEAEDILSTMACALQKLGKALLPKLGTSPIEPMLAARSDVQELVGLLGALTCRNLDASKGGMHFNDVQDPFQLADPWSNGHNVNDTTKGKGKTLRSSGLAGKGVFVPPPMVETVEKIVEVPTVKEKIQTVEKIVEVPSVVEKIIEIEKFIERPRPEHCHVEVQAVDIIEKTVETKETMTEPSPLYSVVNAEMTEKREFVSKLNANKNDMIEVAKRAYRLIDLDPGIKDVNFLLGENRIELIMTCRDSRIALGDKGTAVNQATGIIRDAIGAKALEVFVQRAR